MYKLSVLRTLQFKYCDLYINKINILELDINFLPYNVT